ncbi:unnamed protein product, partial [Iphiclides podalirius]
MGVYYRALSKEWSAVAVRRRNNKKPAHPPAVCAAFVADNPSRQRVASAFPVPLASCREKCRVTRHVHSPVYSVTLRMVGALNMYCEGNSKMKGKQMNWRRVPRPNKDTSKEPRMHLIAAVADVHRLSGGGHPRGEKKALKTESQRRLSDGPIRPRSALDYERRCIRPSRVVATQKIFLIYMIEQI